VPLNPQFSFSCVLLQGTLGLNCFMGVSGAKRVGYVAVFKEQR
jgi:hypothetical protein